MSGSSWDSRTSHRWLVFESHELLLQRVPGANEDGRTTTRERQRGLDPVDIESETTTKMGAVQWRRLCIKGPGRKTKSLIWCGGETRKKQKFSDCLKVSQGEHFATTSSTTSDVRCVGFGWPHEVTQSEVDDRAYMVLHHFLSDGLQVPSRCRETCKLQVFLHLGTLSGHFKQLLNKSLVYIMMRALLRR